MKWFGRGSYVPVNGADSEDVIEVDRISFASSCSDDENENNMQNHQTDLISFEDTDQPGPSEISTLNISEEEEPQTPSLFSRKIEVPLSSLAMKGSDLVRNSIFWFNEDEVDTSKLILPISNKGRISRFENDVDDNQLETMCRSLQITIGLTERNRWLNAIAANPEMLALAQELDAEFPLCPAAPPAPFNFSESDNCGVDIQREPATSISTSSSSNIGSFQAMACVPSTSDAHLELEPYAESSRIVRTIIPPRKGIEKIEIRRRINETPQSICSAILRKSVYLNEPKDRRMFEWMRGFAEVDTWIQEVAPTSRKHDKYAVDVPTLTEDWVLQVHKQPQIRQGLDSQQWKCASCRQSLHAHNINDKDVCPRFCEYYGLYFCTLCHGAEKTIIPSRVLNLWSFNEVPVSDRAFRFLRDVRELPVFKIRDISMELIKKNKLLKTVIDLRDKLKHMEQFIKICVAASEQVAEFGNLSTMFASLDRYLLETDDLFSLNDLLRVYNKDLLNLLEPLAKVARNHILKCRRCSNQAHLCVKCNDPADKLFPFEDRILRCEGCGGLSHFPKCPRRDVPKDSSCPKCARISKTRSRQRILAVGTIGDV